MNAVTKFLLDQGVHRITKTKVSSRVLKPTQSTLSNIFHDPFYYGILIQAKQTINLCDLMNFEPMVTKEIYDQVQSIGYGRTKDHSKLKRSTFYPLRGFVYCAVCNSPKYMLVGKNKTGSGRYVLSYRCDNKQCIRKPKSLRAKHIFNDSLYPMLESLEFNDDVYSRYSNEIDLMTNDMIIDTKQDIHSKRGLLAHVTAELNNRALKMTEISQTSVAYKPNIDRLEELAAEKLEIEKDISILLNKVSDPNKIKLSKQHFLNQLKTASDKMKVGSAVEKDILCRILFLNLRVDNEKVVNYIWNEPFASLIKSHQIQDGGGTWT